MLGPFPIFNVGEGPSCMSFWRLLIATYMKQVAMYATAYYVKPQAALYSLGASLCLEIFAFFHLLFCRFYFSKLFLEWKIKSKLIEWYVNYVNFFFFFLQWFRASSLWYPLCLWFQAYMKLAARCLNDVTHRHWLYCFKCKKPLSLAHHYGFLKGREGYVLLKVRDS